MQCIVLVGATFLVGVKDFAYAWTLIVFLLKGGQFVTELREGRGKDLRQDMPARLNPVDGLLKRLTERQGAQTRVGRWIRSAYLAPTVITVATILEFGCGSGRHPALSLVLGVATALCALFVVLTALLRRLILGPYDWQTSDVQIPKGTRRSPGESKQGCLSDWAIFSVPGANNTIYFLVMLYLSTIGFAALYFGLSSVDRHAFSQATNGSPLIAWLYFSVTIVATIGSGISAVSDAAKIAVLCQITTGPLLLSWLLAVFLGQGHLETEVHPTGSPQQLAGDGSVSTVLWLGQDVTSARHPDESR